MRLMRTLAALAAAVPLATPAVSAARVCPGDSVQVGDVCVDKYEASVWSTTDVPTIRKIRRGTITSAVDLALATQHGAGSDDYGTGCPDDAAGCTGHYAVSVAGVQPSADLTQFQAMAVCRNAGKHLVTNHEWQAAAFGTPDPGLADNGMTDCATNGLAVVATGSRASCVSDAGAFDTTGNLIEWVADWVPASTTCGGWSSFSDDDMCLSGASTVTPGPGVLQRGGYYGGGVTGGTFSVIGANVPWLGSANVGFRCARRL
jgi:hypothetical protein